MASHGIGPFLTADRPLTTDEIGILGRYDSWELATLEPWSEPEIVGDGDTQTVAFGVYRADIDNGRSTDLSDAFHGVNGYVDLNHDREVKTQATLSIRDPALLEPYRDFVSVWLERSYTDGAAASSDQLGLFGVRVPPGTRTIERADAIYTGYDLTATLARYAFADAYNIAASSNYVEAVMDIIDLAGISRTLIEPTTQTTAGIISFPVGTSYLTACNTLLAAIGYYQLAAMPDGRLFSMPVRALHLVEPYRTITDDDLMRPVDIQPLDTTVANIVIVVKDDPSGAPLTAVRRNDAADSPTSTVNIGPITRVVTQSDLADQDAVDALADRLLSEGRSFYQTAKLALLPDPRALIPHQTIDLQLTGELAILNGRWWVRTARVPLSTKPTELEINRVTDTINGTLI